MGSLAERVRTIVTESGLSMRAFARKAGLAADSHVEQIVSGRVKNPAHSTLEAIARAGNVELHWVSTGRGTKIRRVPSVELPDGPRAAGRGFFLSNVAFVQEIANAIAFVDTIDEAESPPTLVDGSPQAWADYYAEEYRRWCHRQTPTVIEVASDDDRPFTIPPSPQPPKDPLAPPAATIPPVTASAPTIRRKSSLRPKK